jgi:hypothetical protein
MPSTNDDPDPVPDGVDDEDEPTALAEDGMAPLITNTGADDSEGEDADAASG